MCCANFARRHSPPGGGARVCTATPQRSALAAHPRQPVRRLSVGQAALTLLTSLAGALVSRQSTMAAEAAPLSSILEDHPCTSLIPNRAYQAVDTLCCRWPPVPCEQADQVVDSPGRSRIRLLRAGHRC